MRVRRVLMAFLLTLCTVGLSLVVATSADAKVYSCGTSDNPWYCAKVVSIDSGSCLRQHKLNNYTSGDSTSWCGTNGSHLYLQCWTTGDPDADGHGDRIWFWTTNTLSPKNGVNSYGYVNDWYLDTAGSSYKSVITQCKY